MRGQMSIRRALAVAGSVCAILVAACGDRAAAQSNSGITDATVTLGTTAPLSGPAVGFSTYARQMDALFKYVNEQGGIKMGDGKTRKINFIIKDDGSQPSRTVAAARELAERDNVFALLGPFGTNTNLAMASYLNGRKLPHVFVLSAATAFGDPAKLPWSIGFPSTTATEARVFLGYVLRTKPNAKIAVFYPNDDYGKGALEVAKKIVTGTSASIVAAQSYESSDPTVDSQIVTLSQSGADVLLNFSIGRPTLQSMQKVKELGWAPMQYIAVASSSSGLVRQLPPDVAAGVMSTAYVKDPNDTVYKDDPAIKLYTTTLGKYYGTGFDPTAQPLGVAVAQAFLDVLANLKTPTREALMNAVRSMDGQENPYLIKGIKLTTTATDGFPVDQLQVIKYENGHWAYVGDAERGDPM